MDLNSYICIEYYLNIPKTNNRIASIEDIDKCNANDFNNKLAYLNPCILRWILDSVDFNDKPNW